jgi:hypothetical protein
LKEILVPIVYGTGFSSNLPAAVRVFQQFSRESVHVPERALCEAITNGRLPKIGLLNRSSARASSIGGTSRRYQVSNTVGLPKTKSNRSARLPRILQAPASTIPQQTIDAQLARSSVSRWILGSCGIPSPNRLPPFRDMR